MGRTFPNQAVSKEIDGAIKRFGSTIAVAKMLGLSTSQVGRIRGGKYNLKLEHAMKLEEEMKIPVVFNDKRIVVGFPKKWHEEQKIEEERKREFYRPKKWFKE